MKENFKEKDKAVEEETGKEEIKKEETGESKPSSDLSQDSLALLVELSKKRLFWQRFSAGCFAGMLLVMIIAVMVLIPKVSTTLTHINTVATKAETSLGKVDTMTSSVETTAGNLNKLLNDNGEKLTSAVKSISEIDFAGLNQAITDLQSAVSPLAKLFGKSN